MYCVHVYKQYIHSHGYDDATLQTTIYTQEQFSATNFPLYLHPLVQSHSIRTPPWPSPSLSGDIVASPARLPSPRRTYPLTDLAPPNRRSGDAADKAAGS